MSNHLASAPGVDSQTKREPRMTNSRLRALLVILAIGMNPVAVWAMEDAKDWPMYNRDVVGTRHSAVESAISTTNAAALEEKWRFTAKGSDLDIGVVHATPIVVGGCVYFGSATDPAFYKLSPDGKLRWTYRNPTRPQPKALPRPGWLRNLRFQSSPEGILG